MNADNPLVQFKVPRFVVYRVICDILEEDGRLTEAVECFCQLQNALPEETAMHNERVGWERGGWLQPRRSPG